MGDRWRARVAATVAVTAAAALVAAQALAVVREVGIRGDPPPSVWGAAVTVVLFGTFLAVGGIVAARRPRHPVGWLLLATGVAWTTLSVGGLLYGLADGERLRALGTWLDAGLWHPSFPALGLLLLLFPTGTPPTRRWRWLQHLLVACWAFLVASAPFTRPGLMLEFYPDATPLLPGPWSTPLMVPHDTVQMGVVFLLLPLTVVSMVARAVRSSGLERQQLKWFATSTVVAAVMFATSLTVVGNGSLGAPVFALLPISCAIAVLRYRLYDLGRIVRRGVVYVVLTGVLLAVYAVGTVGLGELVGRSAPGSSLQVAATTLLVAALFRPLRRRVQLLIDRAFYRARYDGEAAASRFAGGVRTRTELEQVRGELFGVVDRTLHPATMSLWLRDTPAGERP